jgi:D-arginine dehydrogenase
MSSERIVILGGGIAGLATAWFLAERGARDVVVVERETGLARHATAQNAAILRTAMPDPIGESLARESAEFLRSPPRGFAQRPLVDECGLVVTTARGELSPEWARRLSTRPRSEVTELTAARFARIAPHFAALDARAFLFPREGVVDLAALVSGFAEGARERGVRFELGAEVREIDAASSRVLLARGGAIEADRIVIAAGAWAGQLARRAGSQIDVRPTRRHVLVTRSSDAIDRRWPIVWSDAGEFYARVENGALLVCPCDEVGVDPDALAIGAEELAHTRRKMAQHVPRFAELPAQRFWAGIRTHSMDERFAVGPDPDLERVFWVAGLGGHGITCSAIVGRIAADGLTGAAHAHPLAAHLDPARFVAQPAPTAAASTARAVP